MKPVIYTAVLGNRSNYHALDFPGMSKWRRLYFTDKPIPSSSWTMHKAVNIGDNDARLSSKLFKLFPQNHFVSEYNMWLDGTMSVRRDPIALVRYMEEHKLDMLACNNHNGNLLANIRRALFTQRYKPRCLECLNKQLAYCKANDMSDYPAVYGGWLLRKSTASTAATMDLWYEYIQRFGVRCQPSLAIALQQSVLLNGLKLRILTSATWCSYFRLYDHKRDSLTPRCKSITLIADKEHPNGEIEVLPQYKHRGATVESNIL